MVYFCPSIKLLQQSELGQLHFIVYIFNEFDILIFKRSQGHVVHPQKYARAPPWFRTLWNLHSSVQNRKFFNKPNHFLKNTTIW